MNILLLFAGLTILPILCGQGVLKILYFGQKQKVSKADSLIVGWLVLIGIAEVAHVMAVFMGWSFSNSVTLWGIATTVSALVMGAWGIVCGPKAQKSQRRRLDRSTDNGRGNGYELTPVRFVMILVFVLAVIWQIMTAMSGYGVHRAGDMTVETVESFLETDQVYVVNPLTGRAYESGIPLRIKILGLPTLYGALCSLFNISGVDLVWRYIPLLVLLLSFCAFWLIAGALFDGAKEKDKRLLFMVFVALIFCVGDYAWGMDGYGLLHCGFAGVTIRNTVLVPYALSLALRHRWRPAVLVVMAEACIAWTFYGMGVTLVLLVGMALVRLWQKRKIKGFQTPGEEA